LKILLAVDGSVDSNAAIDEITRRPWPSGCVVKVITAFETPIPMVMEPWISPPQYFEELEKTVRESAQRVIDSALEKLASVRDRVEICGEIIEGQAKQVIVEEAERWGADLIVLGSRGLGAWNRLLLGSVSTSVLNHAKCSVEVVRQGHGRGNELMTDGSPFPQQVKGTQDAIHDRSSSYT
jgi:nucleotide-binding universal stress UspA family protein